MNWQNRYLGISLESFEKKHMEFKIFSLAYFIILNIKTYLLRISLKTTIGQKCEISSDDITFVYWILPTAIVKYVNLRLP